MNPFLVFPLPSVLPKRPNRIYAKLDDLVELAKGGVWEFLLGGLDADWFDSTPDLAELDGQARLQMIDVMPVFYLEFEASLQYPLLPLAWGTQHFGSDDWVEVRLQNGTTARLYRNLYGEAEPVEIAEIKGVPRGTASALDRVHDLSEWEATDERVRQKLSGLAAASSKNLAVYDVGQGAANSGSSSSNKPVFYFDFGVVFAPIRRHAPIRHRISVFARTPSSCFHIGTRIIGRPVHSFRGHWSSIG
jgi:hypothetical protein